MKHRKDHRKLGRRSGHRKALLCNLVRSLFIHERIKTTLPKAKELRRVSDRIITLGKRQDTHARRLAFALLRDKEVTKKLFEDIAGRFEGRNGGYTRVLKLGPRKGDGAPMALVELVERREEEAEKETKKKKEKQ
jgi:large subunit ribosomal protein L17